MDIQEEFNKLDIKKSLGIGLGLAAFYWIMLFNDGSVLRAQIANTETQISKSQASLTQVKKAIEDKARFQKDIEDITLNMKDFQKYFAVGVDSNKLLLKVSSFAENHGLSVESAKAVEKEKEFPAYEETAVEFVVEGNFHNVMEFIASLTRMEKAIDFAKMEFSTEVGGDFPVVRFATTLVVYSSNEELGADPQSVTTPGGSNG